jgi:hypothetical protein
MSERGPYAEDYARLEREGHDFAEHERELKADIEERYYPTPGVTIQEVHLQGSYPETVLILLFRTDKRPGQRLRWEWPVWEDHVSSACVAVAMANFEETLAVAPDSFRPA